MTIIPSTALPPFSRVAIIGAGGASGLAAIAQLLDKGAKPDQIVGYEARDTAGGVWNYDEDAGQCNVTWAEDGSLALRTEAEIYDAGRNGPNAIYDGLRTNLPQECMTFRDTPHQKGTETFPTYHQIASYLQNYAKDKGLLSLIRFKTLVRQVHHTPDTTDTSKRWTVVVEYVDVKGKLVNDLQYFSHIIITNGHFNVPYVPSLPGLRSYQGQILHSRWWRNPRSVRGKNIIIVGSHASGTDIARDIALDDEATDAQTPKLARKIYQSVREKDKPRPNDQGDDQSLYPNTKWRDQVETVPEIERVEGDLVYLKGGKVLSGIDVILCATGYLYSYPFFSPDKAPFDSHPLIRSSTQEERRLSAGPANRPINLDETDTFYVPDKTLAFIGLHRFVNPLPLFERSARLIAHCYINGSIPPLPPLKRDSDIPGDLNIGHPQEFENQDEWLKAIGDGDEWKVPQRLRDLRGNAIKIRKELLGY